jgi:HD-GYP domain-containing protein (c-di-GMP phosphodiesterase class II)
MLIIKLKEKIPKIMVLPLIILFVFSVYSGIKKFEEKDAYTKTHDYSLFATAASDLIHELQKERGYGSGFAASKGKFFFNDLKEQRKKSDKSIEHLKFFLTNFEASRYSFPFEKHINKFLLSLSQIDKHRIKIDNHELHGFKTMDYYTDNINILLKLIENIVTISHNSELGVLAQSYIMLMKAKEKAGIERAFINRIFSQGTLSNNEFYIFGKLVSAQDIYIKQYNNMASNGHIDMLSCMTNTDSCKDIVKERNIVFSKNNKNKILSSIKEYIGYGGLIHSFKNYVIRGDVKYANNAKKQYAQILRAIDKYKAIENLAKEEIDQLNIIEKMSSKYIQNITQVANFAQKDVTVTALDNIIKIDDTLALKALSDLTTDIYGSPVKWFKHSTNRINAIKKAEDKIAFELHFLIEKQITDLLIALVAQGIVLFVVIIVALLLVEMIREVIKSEKMLNRAQKSTKSGSYEYYIKENIIVWSDEHYRLLQVDKKRFKPTLESFMKFVHPDDVDIVQYNLDLAKTSKKIVSFEYRIVLRDGTEIFIASSCEVIKYDIHGDALIMVGTITDISKAKKLDQEIVDTQKDVIFTMGAIGETRSHETGQHVKRVAEYSKLLYLLVGANEEESELLKMASPMHDIGKIGIPDDILNKPGKLTPSEWAIMQTHSELGYEMLKNSNRDILKLAATVALSHHEKYDGSGYPNGLLANEIPIVGRITALADVFDALGSDRCYKRAWKIDEILELIKQERARHFDPQLVDLFLENLDKFLDIRDEYKDRL